MIFTQEYETLKFCKTNEIGVIPHSVLSKGLLGGKYKPGHTFASDDERRLFNFFRGPLFEAIYEVTEKLKAWAEDRDRDLIQLAVAWVIANPAVTSAIVGMKSVTQVENVAKAATWKLTDSDLSDIKNIIGDLSPLWIKDQVS